MRCGDLERYLEAFLDGRLGRSRGAVLRRHLSLCAACRARVERLRQFERDTQRRLRAAEQPGSVWEGLELDLVGSSSAVSGGRLPPMTQALRSSPDGGSVTHRPRKERHPPPMLIAAGAPVRGTVSRVAGVLLVAMALGAVYQLARGERGSPAGGTAAQAYLAHRREPAAPTLSSDDPHQVADWLAAALGRPVPPPPVPDGFELVGASRSDLVGGVAGVLIYARTTEPVAAPVMLFVRPDPDGTADPDDLAIASGATDLQEVRWGADNLSYTAVGPFPTDQLRLFQR